jgi:hypothetical protein
MKNRPIIRPATAEDLERYFPGVAKPTVKAWVGELDGELLGIGGIAFCNGRWFGFCDLREKSRRYKLTIGKTAKMIMGEVQKQGIKFIYADVSKTEPGAMRWLQSLGFSLDPRSMYFYRWEGD